MNPLDESLTKLFAEEEPDTDSEAFVASVHKRVAWRARGAQALGIGLIAAIAVASVAVVSLAPDVLLYPAQFVQSALSSPVGAAACAIGAIALSWWTRHGEA